MNGRDDRGRFLPANEYASIGGRCRAARLTPERRRAIARAGFEAMCARHYGGDTSAAARALARAQVQPDAIYYGHTFRG